MIDAGEFIDAAADRGFDFYTGVPCSYLTPLINRVIGVRGPTRVARAGWGCDYVGAASEGEAVAIAAGAWLAGRRSVVMCQNSGLGNAVNPLTSLNEPFRIPVLLVITWRGRPGKADEPQHALMGRVTPDLLRLIGVPHLLFPDASDAVAATLDRAEAHMDATERPFALLMAAGSVAPTELDEPPILARPCGALSDLAVGGPRPSRLQVLERLLAELSPADAVIATTGKCGRELFTLADREQHLYQVGSMGGASAMALGVALNTSRRVVVLDGDGAALMKLGNMATIGACHPEGFLHILLDNGVHDSTGGQKTAAATVDFAGVALACGYMAAWRCDSLPAFSEALASARDRPGPALIHVRIRPGSLSTLGRPSLAPSEVARRFRNFLTRRDDIN